MSDPLTVTFRPTFADTVRALRDIGSTLRWVRLLRRTGVILPPLAVALALVEPRALPTALFLLLLGVFVLLLGALAPVVGAWKVRYENPIARAEQVVVVDARGILTTAGGGRSFLAWPDVVRVAETRRSFLVHTSAQAASWLPKHAFTPAERDAFRSLAEAHAGRPLAEGSKPAPEDDIGPVRLEASFRSGMLDLYRAGRALRRHGSLRWTWALVVALVAAVVLVPVYAELGRGSGVDWGRHARQSAPLVLAVLLGHPLMLLWAAWSESRTSRVANQEQRLRVGERGIRGEGPSSATTVRWEAVVRVVETRAFFLFYLNGETGFALPKRALSPGEVAATREFLAGKLGFNFLRKDRAAAAPAQQARAAPP